MAQSRASQQGSLLIAIWLNVFFFGLVSQQLYDYFACGFGDRIHLRLFVVVQFTMVGLQSILMWHLAYVRFVTWNVYPSRPKSDLWEGPSNAICQLIIIMFANMFLASRIYSLTKSHFQTGLVVLLSLIAFVVGMINVVGPWKSLWYSSESLERITSIVWHVVQAVAECFITFFLTRVLLKSRSGIRKSDRVISYLVRTTIQTGGLATAWAIAGLGTWFLLPGVSVYRLLDLTSGTVYTHAIFETLLSRVKLREQMSIHVQDLTCTAQATPNLSSGSSRMSRTSHPILKVQDSVPFSLGTSRWTKYSPRHTDKSDAIELQAFPEKEVDDPL